MPRPPKRGSTALLVVVATATVIGSAIVFVAVGSSTRTPDATISLPAAIPTFSLPPFPGTRPTFAGDAGTTSRPTPTRVGPSTFALGDWAVAASVGRRTTTPTGERVCGDVAVRNRGQRLLVYTITEWSLLTPKGRLRLGDPSVPRSIVGGALQPGQSVSGAVCFTYQGKGDYVLVWAKDGETARWPFSA